MPVIDVTPAVERYEQAQDTWDTVNDLMDWFNFDRSDQQSDQAYNDLTDTDHYREGVETAVTGSEEDRLNWIAETFDRMGDALAHATDLLNTLPDGREGEGEFDPSDGLYVPGNTGAQRLGGSSRFF